MWLLKLSISQSVNSQKRMWEMAHYISPLARLNHLLELDLGDAGSNNVL